MQPGGASGLKGLLGFGLDDITLALILLGLLALALSLLRGFWRETVEIQPLSVPPDLAATGMTGEVAARRLADALTRRRKEAREDYVNLRAPEPVMQWAEPDFEVPGVKLSLRSLTAFVRRIIGLRPTTVSGDLIGKGSVRAVLRVSGRGVVVELAQRRSEPADALLDRASHAVFAALAPLPALAHAVEAGTRARLAGEAVDGAALESRCRDLAARSATPTEDAIEARAYAAIARLRLLGDGPGALRDLAALIAAEPDAPSPAGRPLLAAMGTLWRSGRRGRWVAQRIAGVIDRLSPAARRARALATLRNAAGVIRYDTLDHAGAEACFRAAIARYPFAAHFHSNLAGSLAQLGRGRAAETAALAAVATDPERCVGWWWLTEARMALGNADGAAVAAERASRLATDPGDMTSPARLAQWRGDWAEAERLSRALIARYPRHQVGYIMLGHVFIGHALAEPAMAQDLRGLAVREYRRALAIAPDDTSVHLALGAALLALGRAEEAAAAFTQCLRRAPDAKDAQDGLAAAQRQMAEAKAADAALLAAGAPSPQAATPAQAPGDAG